METSIPGEVPQPTPAGTSVPAPEAQNEKNVITGKNFLELSKSSMRASVVSPACRSYIEGLIREANRLGLEVETVNTGTVSAQVIYEPNKFGVAIIFATGTSMSMKRAYAEKLEEVISAFHARESFKNVVIITGMVVDESSFDRAELMVDAVYNTIRTVEEEDARTINRDSFRNSNGSFNQLIVSTKPEVYREYVRAVSPFGFSERDDIGFLVGIPKQNCPNTEKFDLKPETHTILFAVTGYTQFVRMDNLSFGFGINGQKTVQPVVHITSIISDIPSMVMLPPAITIAATSFIAHRNWMRPYLTINGKEQANVGNLVINTDASGNRTTMDVEAPFQAEQVLEQTCTEPILCLDITIGRYGIPGIECLLGTKDRNGKDIQLTEILHRYYGNIVPENALNVALMACPPIVEYTGSMNIDNTVVDSRCGDYLRMFKRINDYNQVCCLLSQPNDPSARLQQLTDLGLSVRSLYKTMSVILTKNAVALFAQIAPPYELDLMNDARFNHNFSGIAAAQGISSLQGGFSQPTYGYTNFSGPFSRY